MMHRRNKTRGLTLLELMMAITIGTIIMAATAGVFVTTLDSWERGSNEYAVIQTTDKVGALIERHLRSALPPGQDDTTVVFSGEDLSLDPTEPGHRLTLRSSAPGRFPRNVQTSDSCEIAFEYDPLGEDGMTMRIHAPPDEYPHEGGYLISLSPLIRGFQIFYYDGTEWVETWNEDALPIAVEYHLYIAPPGAKEPSAAVESKTGNEFAPASAQAQMGTETPLIKYSRLVWLPMGEAFSADQGTTMTQQVAPSSGENENEGGGNQQNQQNQPNRGDQR